MTTEERKEVTTIMMSMDKNLQEYALDMLRHLKAAQTILIENKKSNKAS